ncbi:MAG: hypothetical protein RL660_1262 [Bacteroidota bacterium]
MVAVLAVAGHTAFAQNAKRVKKDQVQQPVRTKDEPIVIEENPVRIVDDQNRAMIAKLAGVKLRATKDLNPEFASEEFTMQIADDGSSAVLYFQDGRTSSPIQFAEGQIRMTMLAEVSAAGSVPEQLQNTIASMAVVTGIDYTNEGIKFMYSDRTIVTFEVAK